MREVSLLEKGGRMSTKSGSPPGGKDRGGGWVALGKHFANIQNIPSGILDLSDAAYQAAGDRALEQGAWEQRYQTLRRAAVAGARLDRALPSLRELMARAQTWLDQGVVPVALAWLRYHRLERSLRRQLLQAQGEDQEIPGPEELKSGLEEGSEFFASALLPTRFRYFEPQEPVHRGLAVRLVLDQAFCLSNTGQVPASVRLDLDDGLGWREVVPGRVVETIYPEPGDKQVSLQCRYGEETREARFTLKVRAPYRTANLHYDEKWDITASIPYEGQAGQGTAYLYLGSEDGVKHTQIVNPILIADGFPGHDLNELIGDNMLNQDDFFLGLLAGGYDAIVLTYTDGTDFIQRNALMAVECINQIIQRRQGQSPLVCGGASMGGLVVRYALAYMENQGMDHATGIYFSMDTPHKGANLPLGVQFCLRVLEEEGELDGKALQILELLDSTASRQMLIYYLQGTSDGPVPVPDPEFIQFFNELEQLGGYPSLPSKIAVACGSCKGVNLIPSGSKVMDWSGNLCANGEVWSTPQQPDGGDKQKVARFYIKAQSYQYKVSQCYDQDGAPGGTTSAFGELASQLDKSGYGQAEAYFLDNCFVSSVSALDLAGTQDPCQAIPVAGADTPFDQYWIRYQNLFHTQITYTMKRFFYRVLGILPPVERELVQPVVVTAARSSPGIIIRKVEDISFQGQDRRVEDVFVALNQFEIIVTGASDTEFREMKVSAGFLSKEKMSLDYGACTTKANVAFSGGACCLVLGQEEIL